MVGRAFSLPRPLAGVFFLGQTCRINPVYPCSLGGSMHPRFRVRVLLLAAAALPIFSLAQDAWPTYNGDFSGRRFSPLTEINASNIGSLSLAWFYRVNNIAAQRGVGN